MEEGDDSVNQWDSAAGLFSAGFERLLPSIMPNVVRDPWSVHLDLAAA